MIFCKLCRFESKRLFRSPGFYITAGLLFALTLAVSLFFFFQPEALGTNAVYDVSEYESFDELALSLKEDQTRLDREIQELESGKLIHLFTQKQIRQKQANIDYFQKNVHVKQYLLDHRIAYDDAVQYRNGGGTSANSMMSLLVSAAALFFCLLAVFRIALAIPNELKDGQAKLTLTLPVSRTKYAVYRSLLVFLETVFFFFVYVVFAVIVAGLFFSAHTETIFASTSGAFGLRLFPAALLEFLFAAAAIAGVSIVSFSVSLLVLNRVGSLLISVFLCFSGELWMRVEGMLPSEPTFTRFLLSTNFDAAQQFANASASPWWQVLLVLAGYCVLLAAAAIIKFKRQNIMS